MGTHPAFLAELVAQREGTIFEELCRIFFREILAAKPDVIENLTKDTCGLALVILCDWGKHRSLALLFLLLWLLIANEWAVLPEYVQLCRFDRSQNKCTQGGLNICPICDRSIAYYRRDKVSPFFLTALDIFLYVQEDFVGPARYGQRSMR